MQFIPFIFVFATVGPERAVRNDELNLEVCLDFEGRVFFVVGLGVIFFCN